MPGDFGGGGNVGLAPGEPGLSSGGGMTGEPVTGGRPVVGGPPGAPNPGVPEDGGGVGRFGAEGVFMAPVSEPPLPFFCGRFDSSTRVF